jgi:hypothetical protein
VGRGAGRDLAPTHGSIESTYDYIILCYVRGLNNNHGFYCVTSVLYKQLCAWGYDPWSHVVCHMPVARSAGIRSYSFQTDLTTVCQSTWFYAPCAQEPRQLGAGAPLIVLWFVPVHGCVRD